MSRPHSANADEPTPRRARRLSLRGLLQIVVGIGALAVVIARSDMAGLAAAMRNTRASLLTLALLATIAVTWLMAYRWRVILAVRGHRLRTSRLFVYYLIGIFFSNFVPGGGVSGDIARLLYVDREVRDKAFVLSTLVYERMVGLFTLLLIGLGAMLVSRTYRPEGRVIYLAEAVLMVAFIGSAMLMSQRVASALARIGRAVAARLRVPRLGEAAARTLEAISELRRHKLMLVETIFLSVLIRIVWGLGCYVVAVAMGLPVSLPVMIAFIALVDLIRLLPISVGGLGVREWALIALFANLGIAREQALLFSFLAFAPVVLNAIAGGIFYILSAGLPRREAEESRLREMPASRAEA